MKNNNGITTISLVITIIIVLILSIITMTLLGSENGIIAQALKASNDVEKSEFYETINIMCVEYVLENDIENITMEQFLEKKEQNNVIDRYYKIGEEYVIEIGENKGIIDSFGNPKEYYPRINEYKENEQVVSDTGNAKLFDEYGNLINVPEGFKITKDSGNNITDGIVIEDKDGNQFTWIPVGETLDANGNIIEIELNRYEFNEDGTAIGIDENGISGWGYLGDFEATEAIETTTTHGSANLEEFIQSVNKNSGYYIGTYEASNVNGKIALRKDLSSWNNISQINAYNHSKEMYSSSYFQSELMNSYAWDTAIVYIQAYSGDTNFSNLGNISAGAERCNIFEMASNCYEWTTEVPDIDGRTDSNKYSCVRGTSNQYGDIVSYRGYNSSIQTNMGHVSFRPILFLN